MASQARVYAYLEGWKAVANCLAAGPGQSFASPPFGNPAHPDVRWKLSVERKGAGECGCCRGKCKTCPVVLDFSLALKGKGDQRRLLPQVFVKVSSSSKNFAECQGSEFTRFGTYNLDKPPAELDGAVLDVSVSFVPTSPAENLRCLVHGGVSRLLDEPKFADFEVRVGEERIPIHRALFASFSPVFERMFERDMEEKAQGFVVVEDVSAEAMRGLRAFLYSGRVAGVRNDLPTFLHLAEKYQIAELKDFCKAELRTTLTPANLCSLAVLAKQYRLEELFEDCRCLIKSPDGSLTVFKEDWNRLVREHKDVSEALYTLIFAKPN